MREALGPGRIKVMKSKYRTPAASTVNVSDRTSKVDLSAKFGFDEIAGITRRFARSRQLRGLSAIRLAAPSAYR
jgi:hypothetical protein